jgi:hypothetical protein
LKWGVAIEVVNIQGFVTFLKGGEVEASALASPILLGFRTTKFIGIVVGHLIFANYKKCST